MPKRRRRKTTPILSIEGAYAQLQLCEFYYEVHESVTYNIKDELFAIKCWRFPDFAERLNGRFQDAFDQVYQEELLENVILKYRGHYLNNPKHHYKETFIHSVKSYITNRLHWILSDGQPTDGYGAIYFP